MENQEIITTSAKTIDLTNMNAVIDFADQIKDIVVRGKLYTSIQGKNYVNVEGWQLAGALIGYSPLLTKLEDLSSDGVIKYRAEIDLIRNSDGAIVGRGTALCSNAEYSKRKFDEYAIASMAQTRAVGKAFRLAIGWLLKLAGYEATPVEEMDEVANKSSASPFDHPVTDAVEKLNNATMMSELESIWIHLPKILKETEEVIAAKNAMKIKLMNTES